MAETTHARIAIGGVPNGATAAHHSRQPILVAALVGK
jgi:hypothetical protein